MPIDGLNEIYRVPFIKRKEDNALNLKKRKKKKPKENTKKEKTDENAPETSDPKQKHIDIRI